MKLVRRLSRHLSYANVIASLALFAALGGSAYAGSQINGGKIVKESIGGGKLKKETITSKQIKKGSINSSVINLSTLGTVPSAQTAVTATSATTATSASTATSATTATKASSADTASTAANASHADSADSATSAEHADTAGVAETVEGETKEELTVACPAGTEPFGGICWDEAEQASQIWLVAIKKCSDLGGRLPTISELIAYALGSGPGLTAENWSGDVDSLNAGRELVFVSDGVGRSVVDTTGNFGRGYRCVFYETNAD